MSTILSKIRKQGNFAEALQSKQKKLYTTDCIYLCMFFCSPDDLARCASVSKAFKNLSDAAATLINLELLEKYYHPNYIATNLIQYSYNPQRLMKTLCYQYIMIIKGFVTYKLDINSLKWSRLQDTTRDRGNFALSVLNGEVYAIGTISIIAAGTIEKFNAVKNKWTTMQNLPRPIRLASSAVCNGRLYVIGGFDSSVDECSDLVYYYDPKLDFDGVNTWKTMRATLLAPRQQHMSETFDDKIWVVGGVFGDSELTKRTEFYDPHPDVQSWRRGPDLNCFRKFGNLVIVCNRLYVVGGDLDDAGNEVTRTIERLSLDQTHWEHVAVFKDARRGFSATAIDSKIYIFGGSYLTAHISYHATWDAYDTITGRWDSDVNNVYGEMPVIDDWGQAVAVPACHVTW